jgi:hypothetical protein
MFRLEPGLRAGILAAVLWLVSGAGFAVVVWFGLYRGDVVRLVLVETIPVQTWQREQPWPIVIALASTLAFGASAAWGIARLHTAAAGSSRAALLMGSWLVVVLAGAATGLAAGIGTVAGDGVPRLAFLAQGVPGAVSLGAAAGLLYGWMPAWLSLPPRRPGDAAPASVAPQVVGAVAIAAIIGLIVATGLVVAESRREGLGGQAPPPVVQPGPAPVPTGTPPPSVAPGEHPVDPSWCTSSQLLLQSGGADGATGHRAALLVATNTGEDGCVLPGYPDVAFADEHGVAVEAAVRCGGGFMTDDPGASPFELEPGARAVAYLAWDATDGRTLIPQVYLAPYPGAQRSLTLVDPPFDITAQTEVAVTAWAPAEDDATPAP